MILKFCATMTCDYSTQQRACCAVRYFDRPAKETGLNEFGILAEAFFKAAGWTVANGEMYCPDHKPKGA